MAIRKEEIGALTKGQRRAVSLLEREIDDALRRDYIPGGKVRVLVCYGIPHARVRRELEKRYSEAGWNIKFDIPTSWYDRRCIVELTELS